MSKRKIVVVTEGFPYWPGENFLNGEIACLHDMFDINILPLLLPKKPVLQSLPDSVHILKPVMVRNYLLRFLSGVFNLSPLWPFLKDFPGIFKTGRKNILYNLIKWCNVFINSRSLYSSKQLKSVKKDKNIILYLYWCNYPVNIFRTYPNKIITRVHGSEIGKLVSDYLPLEKERFSTASNISYLPISIQASEAITKNAPVKYTINRLGVFKNEPNNSLKNQEKIRIVSVAYLIPVKRIHLIIEALKEVSDIQIEWVHFGNGPLFQAISNTSKLLPPNIDAKLKGFVPNSEIIDYYKNNYVDHFINVSAIEGVPVSIMEALSFGIPCFATNVGGTQELINNTNGKIVEKDFDVQELSYFIRNIRKLSLQNNYRQNALITWANKSNAIVNYKQLANVFNAE